MLISNDIIIACSTCLERNSAISIIRISGFEELTLFQKLFLYDLKTVKSREMIHSQIADENKNVVDDILFCFFKAPKSFTGENLLELYVHGNRLNVERIITLFSEHFSCRVANPGEFTYRALKNKKMGLSEVEGLDLVLNATTPLMLQQGQKALLGELNQEYQKLYDIFLKIKVSVELMVDFSEDVGADSAIKLFNENLTSLKNEIKKLHQRCQGNLSSILSPAIVILGQTNAGKSTFFNFLLNDERSIVSAKEGTTRDFVSEYLTIYKNSFKLIDSAGIRSETDHDDEIEKEGIKRAIRLSESSFIKVLLVNPFLKLSPYFYRTLKDLREIDLLIFTHSDCDGFDNAKKDFDFLKKEFSIAQVLNFTKELSSAPIEPIAGPKMSGSIGAGSSNDLREKFENFVHQKYKRLTGDDPIILSRHRVLIGKMFNKINSLDGFFEKECDVGIIAQEVFDLGRDLSELIGIITPDHLLTSIFNNFCIGK